MSNWCTNVLIVTGLKEVLMEFEEFAKSVPCEGSKVVLPLVDDVLDFHRFLPYPETFIAIDRALSELDEKICEIPEGDSKRFPLVISMNNLWGSCNSVTSEWCLTHWGTRSGPDTIEVHHDEEKLRYDFYTRCTPPHPVVLAMSRQFPTLNFHLGYWDRIAGFEGIYECADGKVVNEDWREGIFIEYLLQGTVRSMFQG